MVEQVYSGIGEMALASMHVMAYEAEAKVVIPRESIIGLVVRGGHSIGAAVKTENGVYCIGGAVERKVIGRTEVEK